MEFFLGAVFSIIVILLSRKVFSDKLAAEPNNKIKVTYRQSHVFELIKPSLAYMPNFVFVPDTQARIFTKQNQQRFIFADNVAYWIKDNVFLSAAVVDGEIDESTTKVVDTMSMDKVELDKMIFIVERLTEGTSNDGGNSGFKGF